LLQSPFNNFFNSIIGDKKWKGTMEKIKKLEAKLMNKSWLKRPYTGGEK